MQKRYEDVNLKKNKPPAEHQGHIVFPSKSFAAIQNLVSLYPFKFGQDFYISDLGSQKL